MKQFTLTAVILFLSIQLMAQSDLKTKSISVFKNGKSFVVKEGEVAANNGVYTLQEIPGALFGTLWFAGLQSNILQVTGKQEKVDEITERPASSFAELLYANKGKQLTITTTDDKMYTGVVETFDLSEDRSSVILLKTSDKWISISPSSVRSIEFANKPEQVARISAKVDKPLIKVQFAESGKQPLSMMYLQDGISWTPTYLLELQSDTEAQLKLQAEVANDSEDIANTSMNFVVGVPNFKFADEPAMLTSFVEELRASISYYNQKNTRGNVFSNAVMAQVSSNYSYQTASDDDDDEGMDANASEDFYFYNVDNVSLEKGGRAHYPLFTVPVKIKHLYECNLSPMQVSRSSYYYDEPEFSFDIKHCNVFHSIEIKNDSKSPFTTGPVMIIDGKTQRPLSQDLVKYTGIGQASSIQLTQSPDIRVEEQEKIVNTKKQAKRRNGDDYDLLTIQGEVTIVNSKKQDIEMSVAKVITGEIKSATIKYDSKRTPIGSSGINPQDNLKFNPTVKAGQTLKFTYTYEMYVED